jgi:hypothetical protein
VIGSIRREYLGHVIVLSEAHGPPILAAYVALYDSFGTNIGLRENAPNHSRAERHGTILHAMLLAVCTANIAGYNF